MTFVQKGRMYTSDDVCVKQVVPVGIEPTSSESESEILSIILRNLKEEFKAHKSKSNWRFAKTFYKRLILIILWCLILPEFMINLLRPTTMHCHFAFFIIMIMGATPCASQILRVDKNHLESDSAGYFALAAEASFSLDNRSISPTEKLVYTRLHSKADLLYVSKHHAYILINSIEYQSSTNATPFSTGYSHFRINFRRQHKLSYETYAQIQYDEVRRMKLRTLAGGGIRFTAIDEEGVDIHLGTGLMYEVEKWQEIENDPTSDFYKEIPKLSNYLGVEFTLSQHVKLNFWGLYQTGYDTEDNLRRNRYAIEASLNFIISKRVIWLNRFAYFYDAQPVIPINPAFYQLMNGLRISF